MNISTWASCVAYPCEWAMREPEVGISKSTDSHVFLFLYTYVPNSGESIGHGITYIVCFSSQEISSR